MSLTNERTLIERLEDIQDDVRVPIEHRYTARNAIEELRRAHEPKTKPPVCGLCDKPMKEVGGPYGIGWGFDCKCYDAPQPNRTGMWPTAEEAMSSSPCPTCQRPLGEHQISTSPEFFLVIRCPGHECEQFSDGACVECGWRPVPNRGGDV